MPGPKVKINVINKELDVPKDILEACNNDEVVAKIFYNRGYKDSHTIRQMLFEDIYVPTETNEFSDIHLAVKRIVKAFSNKDSICVYGDYDVDGVTSTVTLVECLLKFTKNVMYHVPDRFTEGYGMNEEVIRKLAFDGVNLIITCDCGVSNINEIKLAKELGMDVIVTDHHNVPDELPPADVILNPKLLPAGHKARNISGCAMAYFLVLALLEHFKKEDQIDEYLDLTAMSLIADVVSLNGENRYLLKKGLKVLFSSQRTGLKELFSVIEKDNKMETEEDVAFQIAPRINAAGRMESARLPVELFLTKDISKANMLSRKIDLLNQERKRVQQEIIEQALKMVEDRKKNKTVLVLFNQFWHHGIIGIAAGKVCETYRKPAILLSLKEDGNTIVGSARSTEDINIYELIKQCSSNLLKFGGHSAAAGLSLKKENLEVFTTEIESLAKEHYFINEIINVNVDDELDIEKINEKLYERISTAGPYGEGFEAPKYYSEKVTVVSDRKTQKNHHIMVLASQDDCRIPAVKWFGADECLENKVFNIIYKINRNNYKGNSNIQLTIEQLIESDARAKQIFTGNFIDRRNASFKDIMSGYPESLVFYEGLTSLCPITNIVNRDSVYKTKSLIFLSTPVNTSIFKEIIAKSNPQNVVINFSINPNYEMKAFLINLLGIIKYVIKHYNGRINLLWLSTRLGVEESILKAALKYLKSLGKISFSIYYGDEIYINSNGREQKEKIKLYERNLKNALMEKKAYQDFIIKLEIDKFVEYIK